MFTISKLLVSTAFFSMFAMASPVLAKFELVGTKQVSAVMADASEVQIGEVVFSAAEGKNSSFSLNLDHSKFTDFFLSMREFKCLPSEKEVSCHVPYPYKSPTTVAEGDYAWLEHRLMFLFKRPLEFGAKFWNGIYFKFTQEGSTLVGTPQAIDLNQIGAPPEDLKKPPYGEGDRHAMQVEERWVRAIVIR